MARWPASPGGIAAINSDGDLQKDIDVAADEMMRQALRGLPVAAILSEEAELPEILDAGGPLCVAIDPLDGSANLENNISVGTIFSIRPRGNDIVSTFFEPGTAQCAAGFVVYGPQTTLVLALNGRVDIFILDQACPGVSADRARCQDCAGYAGVRDQRIEPAALARPGSRLYRRMPCRHQRQRWRRFQHALDRLAGR